MSRRKNRKARVRIRAEPAGMTGREGGRTGSLVAEVFSRDGYVNRPAFLGEASELFSAGTFVRSGLTQNTDLLTTVYRENWLAKKIIDMPAEDMTRAWYTLAADIPAVEMDALRRLEAKHAIQNEITNALKWARLYGGSIALMVIRGDEDILDQPLDMDRLFPGCFQGILVLDRSQNVTPSMELEEDLDDPDFGLPKYYDISVDFGEKSFLRVHHSRQYILRELFLSTYHEFQTLSRRDPKEVVNPTKVEWLNQVLEPLMEMLKEEEYAEFLTTIPMPEMEKDKLKGMNYSDVVIILNHYKNLMNRYFRKRF